MIKIKISIRECQTFVIFPIKEVIRDKSSQKLLFCILPLVSNVIVCSTFQVLLIFKIKNLQRCILKNLCLIKMTIVENHEFIYKRTRSEFLVYLQLILLLEDSSHQRGPTFLHPYLAQSGFNFQL